MYISYNKMVNFIRFCNFYMILNIHKAFYFNAFYHRYSSLLTNLTTFIFQVKFERLKCKFQSFKYQTKKFTIILARVEHSPSKQSLMLIYFDLTLLKSGL